MKDTKDVQWVITPTRKRLAATRKRALRSHTEKMARSVCSEWQSHAIQSRKTHILWGLPVQGRGDNIDVLKVRPMRKQRRAMGTLTRAGSNRMAKSYWDILGTWESLLHPSINTGLESTRFTNDQDTQAHFPDLCVKEKKWEVLWASLPSWKQGIDVKEIGSLSSLIVALESRETFAGGSL